MMWKSDFLSARLALRLADFCHPFDVLAAPDLSAADKQEILAAWACDAHAPESRPAFRWLPGTPGPVPVDHVLAALRQLPGRRPGLKDSKIFQLDSWKAAARKFSRQPLEAVSGPPSS